MKRLLIFGSWLCTVPILADEIVLDLRGNTFLSPRSQSLNTARELAGMNRYWNLAQDGAYGTFAIIPEYTRSFRPKRLAEYFFGTNILNISGSQVVDRGELDILADYFGLSQTFVSAVRLEPIMQNMLADFSFYGGYDAWYLRLHSCVVRAKTEIKLFEDIFDDGLTTPYPADYMAANSFTPPYGSFSSAMRSGNGFGQVGSRTFGNFCCPQSVTKLADIHAILGWNFFRRDYAHAGINLHVAIPTGNKPKAHCLFEPMAGNGHHWALGCGVSAHGLIWEKDGEQEWNIVIDGHVRHLFPTRQLRSFDLRPNGFGSRYTLMKQFDATQAYTGVTLPVIQGTTLRADIWVPFEFEGMIIFAYTYNDFSFDLGYNAWVRSREKIRCMDQFAQKTYALKGIQNVTASGINSIATQSTARLHGDAFSDQALVADLNPPVFISPLDINVESAENPMAFTHKLFWQLQYNKKIDNGIKNAFFSLGTEIEFEGYRPKAIFQPNHVAMSQWGMWVKGGLAY